MEINKTLSNIMGINVKKTAVSWTDEVLNVYPSSKLGETVGGAASSYSDDRSGSQISAVLAKALTIYAKLSEGMKVTDEARCAGVAAIESDDGCVVAECPSYEPGIDETDICLFNPSRGTLKTAHVIRIAGETEFEKHAADRNDNTAVLLALMPTLLSDREFHDFYEDVRPLILDTEKAALSPEDYRKDMAVLTSNVVSRFENGTLPLGRELNGLRTLTVSQLQKLECERMHVTGLIAGSISVITSAAEEAGSDIRIPASEFNGKYRFLPGTDPDAAVMDETYKVTREAADICRFASVTTGTNKPFRTFMLLGPSGSGKSETAKAIAAGLGMKFVSYCCHNNTDIYDLLGQFAPNTGSCEAHKESIAGILSDFPTFEDMEFDREATYLRLTGEELGERLTDTAELFSLAVSRLKDALESESRDPESRFSFIRSDVAEGLSSKTVVEIGEVANIANPAVMTALNNLIEFGYIKLPNGETIKRDPDSVLVFTSNVGYAANRPIDQSILSRCDLVDFVETPGEDELIERAMVRTGCRDRNLVESCASKMKLVSDYLKANGIEDGVCGFRELCNMIVLRMTGVTSERWLQLTLVNKATIMEADDRAAIMDLIA